MQPEQSLPDFLQEQFLQRPLALHRQQMLGITVETLVGLSEKDSL